jgi:hypothetical protein
MTDEEQHRVVETLRSAVARHGIRRNRGAA